jgi:hypothetical protein
MLDASFSFFNRIFAHLFAIRFHCITGIQSDQDWFSGSSHEKQRFKIPDTKEKGRTFAHPRIAASGGCASVPHFIL